MNEVILRIIASISSACLFTVCTWKLLGAMQQSGYKCRGFWRWMRKKENLYYNRLCVYSLCLFLSTTITPLCFSFLGVRTALMITLLPFMICGLYFCYADEKYALKIPVHYTGRLCRLTVAYAFFTTVVSYIFIAFLGFLAKVNGSDLYGLIAYVPFAIVPMLLPFIVLLSNAVMNIFERPRNAKFVKRAGQVLDETQIIRVGIVGSYGKTSVKNILKTILSEKYIVVETPESYNTPIGVAKTVYSPAFSGKEVFIAEMGARHAGDIAQLCKMVKPTYAIFTGICPQHIASFGSLDNVYAAKKEIFASGAKVVCGTDLRARIDEDTEIEKTQVLYADKIGVQKVALKATQTTFVLQIDGKEMSVNTKLLGEAAIENIRLAVLLAYEMGVSVEEIAKGIKKLDYIPHRLQLMENDGVYILDDGYNGNPKGAAESLAALARFEGRKCIVTPGIVECGVLENTINGGLGEKIAAYSFDKIILVGDTLVRALKTGYDNANGNQDTISIVKTLDEATALLAEWVQKGDAVLFLNDLPDVY